MSLGFSKNDADSNLYFKILNGTVLVLVLYVDLFLTREDSLIVKCKKDLTSKFEMKDLGHALLSRTRNVVKTQ